MMVAQVKLLNSILDFGSSWKFLEKARSGELGTEPRKLSGFGDIGVLLG